MVSNSTSINTEHVPLPINSLILKPGNADLGCCMERHPPCFSVSPVFHAGTFVFKRHTAPHPYILTCFVENVFLPLDSALISSIDITHQWMKERPRNYIVRCRNEQLISTARQDEWKYTEDARHNKEWLPTQHMKRVLKEEDSGSQEANCSNAMRRAIVMTSAYTRRMHSIVGRA